MFQEKEKKRVSKIAYLFYQKHAHFKLSFTYINTGISCEMATSTCQARFKKLKALSVLITGIHEAAEAIAHINKVELTSIQNGLIQKWLQSSNHQQAESDTVSNGL